MTKIDLDKLPANQRERVEKILHPRNTQFSLKFNRDDIERWRKAAEDDGESLTEWVERLLNKGAEK